MRHLSKYILPLFLFFSAAIQAQFSKKLVEMPVEGDPVISMRIMFAAGSVNDPEGKEGLAALTSSLITDGATKNNSYQAILQKLYPLAAGYGASQSLETTVFSGRVHSDNLDEYYPLFMDALLRPAFNEDDFNRIKDQTLNYLTTTLKYSSDEQLGKAVLQTDIYEGTPYGHLTAGTIPGVKSITIDDVKAFYNKYYNRNNFVLGISGGYSKEFLSKLQKDLNSLPDGQPVEIIKPDYKELNGISASLVEKNAPATAISFGFPIPVTRGSKDWYALAVANSWLGEHRNSSSHLYQVIREERGLNYGDYSYIEYFHNGGSYQMPPANYPRSQQMFEIWIRPVPNETRHFALRAAMRELKDLIDNGMTADEFNLTKNFLSKYVLHYAPSPEDRLAYALDDVFYGIEGSHLQMYRDMMKSVTLEDVNNAVKKYLQYDNLHIAVITKDAEEFKKALAENRPSPITYATPKSDEVMEEDKHIIGFPINIKAENITVTPVEELFK